MDINIWLNPRIFGGTKKRKYILLSLLDLEMAFKKLLLIKYSIDNYTKCFVKEFKKFQKFKIENSYFEKVSVELNLSF